MAFHGSAWATPPILGLKPFWETTQRLEGHGHKGTHGVIWEALPVFDMLLYHIEDFMNSYSPLPPQQRRGGRRRRGLTQEARNAVQNNRNTANANPLLVCYQNAWEVLQKYNNLTDNNYEIYAAATLLNPCLRKAYFLASWTDHAASQIEPMIEKNRGIWESQYRQNEPENSTVVPRSSLSAFLVQLRTPETPAIEDDFSRYIDGRQTSYQDWKASNLFNWWASCEFPGLRQWAFDTLSIPAMSAELERVFAQAKRTITDDRNRQTAATFEKLQCLKHWMDLGLYRIGAD